MLFDQQGLINRARQKTTLTKSASVILNEDAATAKQRTSFDIFLSHSFKDAETILGVKLTLEDMGHSVYVDWITDPGLSRESVTKDTAALLRLRMVQSKCLFYATTDNASQSKWMPWELGFMDGQKQKSSILPISVTQNATDDYKGQEYLGVYPYITKGKAVGSTTDSLWVHESPSVYVSFHGWLRGERPTKRS